VSHRAPLACGLAVLALLALEQPAEAPAITDSPSADVNPFIGTLDHGNTFPGAALPFGMVQLSPDNGATAGYDYDNVRIDGFSHTHLSGVGCGALGEVRVMPVTGTVRSSRPSRFGSHYDHRTEVARPGYYAVDLTRYGVRAELTATARTGWHRYTFPAGRQADLLFDVGRADMPVYASSVRITGPRTVEGQLETGGFCHGPDHHTVYFTARANRPFARTGTWRGDTLTRGGRRSSNGRGSDGAWVAFDPAGGRDVELQVGLSYTGVAGARRNLAAESKGQTFDSVATAAGKAWAATLARARVRGGSPTQQTAFATALYHATLHPNVVSDTDGAYPGADGRVHVAHGYTPMGNLSLWDTFRTQNELLELIEPDVARDVARSLLADAHDGGWLPRWPLISSDTNVMTGDPVTPFLVENWATGLLAGHTAEAYAALRANALGRPPTGSASAGRTGNTWFGRLGYIPIGVRCLPAGIGGDCRRPASATLEYAAADGSLARMARALGHTADADRLARRAQDYRNLYDRRIGAFRPKDRAGHWLTPYDPVTGGDAFHEGNAYTYAWLVPQDPAGLVRLLGGAGATADRLDAFFDYPRLLRDPVGTARGTWVRQAYAYYESETYNPDNEPDLLSPFLYAWTGQPWKTSTVVRASQTLFTAGPDGMTGNDDLGTMSAWYVLTSLGLYPTTSGAGYFSLTTPQFPHATVALGSIPGRQGGTLRIDAPGVADARHYTASAALDGAPVTRAWLPRTAVAHGGHLSFAVAAKPTDWAAKAAPPPSIAPPPG
jgi:predicted alpha-1,2-mannosidase